MFLDDRGWTKTLKMIPWGCSRIDIILFLRFYSPQRRRVRRESVSFLVFVERTKTKSPQPFGQNFQLIVTKISAQVV